MEDALNNGPRSKMVNSKHLRRVFTQTGERYEPCKCEDHDCPRFGKDQTLNTVENVPETMWIYPELTIEDLVKARMSRQAPATKLHLQELQFFSKTNRNPRLKENKDEVLQIELPDYGYTEVALPNYSTAERRMKTAVFGCRVVVCTMFCCVILTFVFWLFTLFNSQKYGPDN